MEILIVLEQDKILKLMHNTNDVNPGVGGTTYTALRLAYELFLSNKKKDYGINITLGISSSLKEKILGIPTVNIYKENQRLWDCAIITGGTLNNIDSGTLLIKSKKTLAWLRHPFDWDKIKKSKKINAEIISVGKSQYISNFLIKGTHHHIDNLFCSKRIKYAASREVLVNKKIKNDIKDHKEKYINIGYMSSLIPSKGFHIVANEWLEIKKLCMEKKIIPRLDVIGGSGLYGFEEGHEFLPCSKEYGDLIYKLIGPEIGKTVFFHGIMKGERFNLMSKCDLAIVNPSGEGEAFPATILEWYSLGVPVISTLNYGCADAMRYSEEFVIHKFKEIKEKILYFIKLDSDSKGILKKKCISTAALFSANNEYILNQWIMLILFPKFNFKINEYLPFNVIVNNFIKFLKLNIKGFLKKIKKIIISILD